MQSSWWAKRRFGISIEASLASVPSWAPLGENPHRYASFLDGSVTSTPVNTASPMPEVLAHHRDRWGHVERYDDFVGLLTFDGFDAERWAELARTAGAGFLVATARHHDGWAWWDTARSPRRLTDDGPRRNVIAELAAACERNGLPLGAFMALSGVGTPDEIGAVHDEALDLVQRHGVTGLWAAEATGPHDDWRGAELLGRLRSVEPGVVINNGWRAPLADGTAASPIVITHVGRPPAEPTDGRWEVVCGLGRSFGHNRAEPTADLLGPTAIIDRYTEAIAKGGHLRLSIGVGADGVIPDEVADRLTDAGDWIRRFSSSIEPCRPWTTWGDDTVRYLDDEGSVIAIDLHGTGNFPALGAEQVAVVDVERLDGPDDPGGDAPVWTQRADALSIARRPGPAPSTGPSVYRVALGEATERIALFELEPTAPTPLAALVDNASSGDIVQLGEGDYAGPVTVPVGVVLRGLGAGRTRIVTPTSDGIATSQAAVTLSRHARLEHVTVVGDTSVADARRVAPVRVGGPFGTVLGCEVVGPIDVTADDAIVRATRASAVTASGADRLLVSRCTLSGDGHAAAISIDGGSDHEVESCRVEGHRCGVALDGALGCAVRGNQLETSRCGVRARQSERVHVHGNQIRSSMRAIEIDGGSDVMIDGNSVSHSDSGCMVRGGATDVTVAGNHWHACRTGLITWSADPTHRDNICVELLDPDATVVSGP